LLDNNQTTLPEQNQEIKDENQNKPVRGKLWPYILLAAVLLAVSLIIGLLVPSELASSTLEELKITLGPLTESANPLILLIIIFLNNAIKSLGAIVLGILLGIPPFFFLVANGFMVGVIATALKSSLGWGIIAASLAPHGIIEIPALVLSSALGLKIGWESLKYLTRRKSSVKAQLRHSIRVYLKWIIIGLLVAAIIEVFVTPLFVLMVGGEELFIK